MIRARVGDILVVKSPLFHAYQGSSIECKKWLPFNEGDRMIIMNDIPGTNNSHSFYVLSFWGAWSGLCRCHLDEAIRLGYVEIEEQHENPVQPG